MSARAGLRGTARMTVTDDDTAEALGSGDVAVLATPRLVALIEEAAVAALDEALEAGTTSVGVAVDVEHLAASPVGAVVSAEATLREVDGRRLHFDVRAADEDGTEVARGRHVRAVVDRERFLANLGRPRR